MIEKDLRKMNPQLDDLILMNNEDPECPVPSLLGIFHSLDNMDDFPGLGTVVHVFGDEEYFFRIRDEIGLYSPKEILAGKIKIPNLVEFGGDVINYVPDSIYLGRENVVQGLREQPKSWGFDLYADLLESQLFHYSK